MEDKNLPCLVLQYKWKKDCNFILVGIDITTTYNFWEKEAFIKMNENSLFPCKHNNIQYKSFNSWKYNVELIPVSDKLYNILKTIQNKISKVFYPGY